MYEDLGDQGHSDEGDCAIVRSEVPSEATHAEGGGSDWRAYVIPSDLADAEREEGDA